MKFSSAAVQDRFESPLGRIILAATDSHLVGLWFDGQRHQPDMSARALVPMHPILQQAKAELTQYFRGHRKTFGLPLEFGSGSPFQQAVWRALLAIPCGTTLSYGALSAAIAKPAAVRAVAAAIGRNPLSIVVPCHRVLGAGGALTGYAGGLERKAALLRLEGCS